MTVIIVSLHNRTAERRWRQNARVWQTWQGFYWPVLWWSSLNIKVSCLLQKICLKEGEVWQNIFFKQNYCHAHHTRFSFFFPLPSCHIISRIKGGQSLWARGQGFDQVFMSMTPSYFHRKEKTNRTKTFS